MTNNRETLQYALVGYKHQREQLDARIAEVEAKLRGKDPAPIATRPTRKRKMTAAGRQRITEATRKRWAEFRAKRAGAENTSSCSAEESAA